MSESATKKTKEAEEERYPVPGAKRVPAKSFPKPFNFSEWIAHNKEKLQPPVGATIVYEQSEDYIVMVVGGPNRRSDYHINQSEEFFFQLKGDMILKVHVDGRFEDIHITEGSVFLLPASVPHSPQRLADTVGLVIERRRTEDLTDRVRWYCDNCRELLYEETLHLKTLQIGAALTPVIHKFYADDKLRTCKKCNFVSQVPK